MRVFEEKQVTPRWIFVILGVDFFLVPGILYQEYQEGKIGQQEILFTLAIIITVNVLIAWLILSMNQYTRVDERGIHYKYTPFIRKWKTIPFETIQSYEAQSYTNLNSGLAVGKWNFFSKNDYLTQMGLEKVIFMNYGAKKPILIGTKKPDDFLATIAHYKQQNDTYV